MKASAGTLVAIIVLSLAVWTAFRLWVPGPPLDGAETMIIVGVCAGLVLVARFIVSRLRRPRGGDAPTR
jgi:hypothetical protein